MSSAEEVASASRRLYDLGWMRGTSGNVAVVGDGGIIITASGVDKSAVDADNTVIVDMDGRAMDGSHSRGLRPSAEAVVDARIIAASGARAVVHVHALSAVIAAERWPDGIALVDVEQLKGIGRGGEADPVLVPVVANSQDMTDLSDRVTAAMDTGVPAVVVARHGLYAWGDSLGQAMERTESLDWLFEYALRLDALPSADLGLGRA
jgi:methylthioribulose-1-phosphate dehydratase